MTTPLRLSPVHDALPTMPGSWREINGMPVWVHTLNEGEIAPRLRISDLSFLTRFGVKGKGAADWLRDQNIPIPDRPNTWHPISQGGIVARLGMSEFLIEDNLHSNIARQLAEACQQPPARVYPVLRQDLAIALYGEAINDLMRQTCSFNFRALSLSERPVILTSMIGVAVTIIPSERDNFPFYRIWCDGTFGMYFWRTLVEIVEELGGKGIENDEF
ncbi:methylglutamate dehydrogenase (plasmid) [Kovacikia minuta CCNUW1]|uniref:methylglutamate dehydrogenase n=1 Tax=Kovacikia minuta TaxID=2931930 RepID=UPI001CCAFBDC|nr:methylglutamate dehydrogenase [Kovacikia minuta]UBF30292.1 methylglutamate dehydrogenase [Kovacikia minuta CCNUW1]